MQTAKAVEVSHHCSESPRNPILSSAPACGAADGHETEDPGVQIASIKGSGDTVHGLPAPRSALEGQDKLREGESSECRFPQRLECTVCLTMPHPLMDQCLIRGAPSLSSQSHPSALSFRGRPKLATENCLPDSRQVENFPNTASGVQGNAQHCSPLLQCVLLERGQFYMCSSQQSAELTPNCSFEFGRESRRRKKEVALGRNQPLKKDKPKWKSDYPMTDGQLRSKRDEFWDTAPAFEGRKEIWDALKAAAHAFESNDHELAQAIIDGASITLPHGALTECYDELGNRYQLPVYCLAPPVNMIEEKSDLEILDVPDPPPNSGHECQLRLRLSTGKDLRLTVRSTDTVHHMKRRLHAEESVAPASQRWFFSGRPLTDKMKLEELKIPKDYVVQVIVSQPLQNPTPVEN
ncbi:UBTD2 protein, partial [Atractosteus spatula]|nr:UBTD2 protein [Atractosteus spatula]